MQVLEMNLMRKWSNWKYELVLMNSWNIEQYGAGIGDDFDAKMK